MYYFVEEQNPPAGECPLVDQWCVGPDRIQGNGDDYLMETYFGVLYEQSVWDAEQGTGVSCDDCWVVEYCEYALPEGIPDEFRYEIISTESRWSIDLTEFELDICDVDGSMCLARVFCDVPENENSSNFWFSECILDGLCNSNPSSLAESFDI